MQDPEAQKVINFKPIDKAQDLKSMINFEDATSFATYFGLTGSLGFVVVCLFILLWNSPKLFTEINRWRETTLHHERESKRIQSEIEDRRRTERREEGPGEDGIQK